jgi:uncharacterized repeat protein (TIGR03803 family)
MHMNEFLRISNRALLVVLTIFVLASNTLASTPTEKTVYSFQGPPDGIGPSGLVADGAGNLYGTTVFGGNSVECCGAVYELSPSTTEPGSWTETVLYKFTGSAGDGSRPAGTLSFDKEGNLYGTTTQGGTAGLGTVFELSPPATAGASWAETVLWSFTQPEDGEHPAGKVVMDDQGNLYGTTSVGGTKTCIYSCGVVFELVAPNSPGGAWTEQILHVFGSRSGDGLVPSPDLLLRGRFLYGTTQYGNTNDLGTIFRLQNVSGRWTETILHAFSGSDGSQPEGALIADNAGNLYGTAFHGGSMGGFGQGNGTIYELSPPTTPGDPWILTTLHMFMGSEGRNPVAGLWRDAEGNLYGTNANGGPGNSDLGTLFKLKPPTQSGGTWTLVVLHSFRGYSTDDGAHPQGTLVFVSGALYGTAPAGGLLVTRAITGGTVFRFGP